MYSFNKRLWIPMCQGHIPSTILDVGNTATLAYLSDVGQTTNKLVNIYIWQVVIHSMKKKK